MDGENSEGTFNPTRRDFLKFTGAAALKLALPVTPAHNAPRPSENVPAPLENKPDSAESKFQLGEYVKRDPIPFPTWAVPVFEPLWPYMDEIGKNFGIDPRIIMGYMAMESKGDMFAGSKRGAVGVMQIIPGPSTSEGWHNQLIHEQRYHEIVDNLRKVGIEIADANYNPYKIVIDEHATSYEGVNNMYSLFSIVLGAYKIARDQRSFDKFSDDERKFLAHLPENPYDETNLPIFEKIKQHEPQIVQFYLGSQNGAYTDSLLGHMAPFNPNDPSKLSQKLLNLYNGTLYVAGTKGGLKGTIGNVVASQTAVARVHNELVKVHPEWKAPLMMIPNEAQMQDKWENVQTTFQLIEEEQKKPSSG